MKVASLGSLRFLQCDRYLGNTLQVVFFCFQTSVWGLHGSSVPRRQWKSAWADSRLAFSMRFGGCAMDGDLAIRWMQYNYLVLGSTDLSREAELVGRATVLVLQSKHITYDSIFPWLHLQLPLVVTLWNPLLSQALSPPPGQSHPSCHSYLLYMASEDQKAFYPWLFLSTREKKNLGNSKPFLPSRLI